MSRASSESRISPLTASAVTRAPTSLHTSPPFTVVRLVRQLMSARVRAAKVSIADKTHFSKYSMKIDSFWPSTDVVHTQIVDVALYLIQRQGLREQVSSSVDTSHFLEVQITLCCFLLDPQLIGVEKSQFAQSSSGHHGESCARISQCHSIHVRTEVFVHRYESLCVSADALTKAYNSASAELRTTTACVLRHVLMR